MTQETIIVSLMSGPKDGLRIRLEAPGPGQTSTWTIGRSEDCDIALPYDTQVSRVHARLVCQVSDETAVDEEMGIELRHYRFQLVDENSRNGTYVKLLDRRLRDEQVDLPVEALFRIGRTWLRVDP